MENEVFNSETCECGCEDIAAVVIPMEIMRFHLTVGESRDLSHARMVNKRALILKFSEEIKLPPEGFSDILGHW